LTQAAGNPVITGAQHNASCPVRSLWAVRGTGGNKQPAPPIPAFEFNFNLNFTVKREDLCSVGAKILQGDCSCSGRQAVQSAAALPCPALPCPALPCLNVSCFESALHGRKEIIMKFRPCIICFAFLHALHLHFVAGTTAKPQQAQQGSNAQPNRSGALTDALKSKDAKTIEQALADSLTDGNSHSSSSGQLSGAISNRTSSASLGTVQQAFSNATEAVGQMLPGVRSAGMLGGKANKTQADAGAGGLCRVSTSRALLKWC